MLGAFVAGMLATGHPALALLAPLAAPRRPLLGFLLLAAAVAGSLAAHARIERLDRSALRLGTSVSEQMTLLDLPHETSFGGWQATVGLRGERVALTAAPLGAAAGGSDRRAPAGDGDAQGRARVDARAQRARGAHRHVRSCAGTARARLSAASSTASAPERIARCQPARVSGLLRGMVLGEGEAPAGRMQRRLPRRLLTHLVAASGQNVALLGRAGRAPRHGARPRA